MRAASLLIALSACRLGFDAKGIDAAEDKLDGVVGGPCIPAPCMAAGGICEGDTCVIRSTSEAALTCPTGMPCRIECSSGNRPCRDGASCGGATVCEVRCIGARACQNGVSCGDSVCTVTCNGSETCESGITVGPAGTCTSHCCGTESCDNGVATCSNDTICN